MPSLFDALESLESICALIDSATRESEVLEYKTAARTFSDSEKGEIAKDVSAMANSLGGTIIYGISTDAVDKTRPKDVEPIEPKNIETFDRVINAQVRPAIEGIRKKLIPNDVPRVMIVEVPPSENPPHQSLYDKRYYRRSGCECVPMEHDLIALQFGRRHSPILSVIFQLLETPSASSVLGWIANKAHIRVLIANEGRRLGRHVHLILVYPSRDVARVVDRAGSLQSIDSLYPGRQAHEFERVEAVFHSGMRKSVAEIGLSVHESFWNEPDTPVINWVLYADGMARREGSITLRNLGWRKD
jgi:hypothetical protein